MQLNINHKWYWSRVSKRYQKPVHGAASTNRFVIMMIFFFTTLVKYLNWMHLSGQHSSVHFVDVCQGGLQRLHPRTFINSPNLSPSVCVQACTQGTIIPMDAPDIPPPPTRQVHLKPTSVNHTIPSPQPFLSPPRPPPRHAHGCDRV